MTNRLLLLSLCLASALAVGCPAPPPDATSPSIAPAEPEVFRPYVEAWSKWGRFNSVGWVSSDQLLTMGRSALYSWDSEGGISDASRLPSRSWLGSLAASADSWVCYAGRSDELCCFDRAGGELRWSHKTPYPGAFAYSPAGDTLYLGLKERYEIQALDTATGKLRPGKFSPTGQVARLGVDRIAVSPDGATFVACAGDATVRLWSVSEQKTLWKIQPFKLDPASFAAFLPGGDHVVLIGQRSDVKVCRADTGALEREFSLAPKLLSIDLSSDGKYLIAAHADLGVQVYSLTEGQVLQTIPNREGWREPLVRCGPGGRFLRRYHPREFGHEAGLLEVFDTAAPPTTTQPWTGKLPLTCLRLAFADEGRQLLTKDLSTTLTWDLERGTAGHRVALTKDSPSSIQRFVASADAARVVLVTGEDAVVLGGRDVRVLSEIVFEGPKGVKSSCRDVEVSRDGRWLALVRGSRETDGEHHLEIHDLERKEPPQRMKVTPGPLAIHPSDGYLVLAADRSLRFVALTPKAALPERGPTLPRVASELRFGPDGSLYALMSGSQDSKTLLALWKPGDEQPRQQVEFEGKPRRLEVSPAGGRVVISTGAEIQVFDAESLVILNTHRIPHLTFALEPKGPRIAIATREFTLVSHLEH